MRPRLSHSPGHTLQVTHTYSGPGWGATPRTRALPGRRGLSSGGGRGGAQAPRTHGWGRRSDFWSHGPPPTPGDACRRPGCGRAAESTRVNASARPRPQTGEQPRWTATAGLRQPWGDCQDCASHITGLSLAPRKALEARSSVGAAFPGLRNSPRCGFARSPRLPLRACACMCARACARVRALRLVDGKCPAQVNAAAAARSEQEL